MELFSFRFIRFMFRPNKSFLLFRYFTFSLFLLPAQKTFFLISSIQSPHIKRQFSPDLIHPTKFCDTFILYFHVSCLLLCIRVSRLFNFIEEVNRSPDHKLLRRLLAFWKLISVTTTFSLFKIRMPPFYISLFKSPVLFVYRPNLGNYAPLYYY